MAKKTKKEVDSFKNMGTGKSKKKATPKKKKSRVEKLSDWFKKLLRIAANKDAK